MTFFSGPLPRQFAHRGASGTHPENTLASFRRARDEGAEAFELDVHRTADGEIVVFHDPTLERTTDGRGQLAGLTLAELRNLDAGSRFSPDGGRTHPFRGQDVRVPTLGEVLEEFPGLPVIIEIKQIEPAMRPDGSSFTDRDIHRHLRAKGKQNTTNEWFRCTVKDYAHLEIPPACPKCGGLVRPLVVLFGEMLPPQAVSMLRRELRTGFDLVVSVGTTST